MEQQTQPVIDAVYAINWNAATQRLLLDYRQQIETMKIKHMIELSRAAEREDMLRTNIKRLKVQIESLVTAAITSVKVIAVLFIITSSNAAITVDLAWDASLDTNAIAYNVYYSKTNVTTPTKFTVGTNLTATVTNLQPGVTYAFWVTCHDIYQQESDPSNVITYTVPGKPTPPLRLRIIIESACVDPKGPWSIERELETIEMASDTQKFYRTRMEITQ